MLLLEVRRNLAYKPKHVKWDAEILGWKHARAQSVLLLLLRW
jgi:hypothetical protein